jgi:hypothetical protein
MVKSTGSKWLLATTAMAILTLTVAVVRHMRYASTAQTTPDLDAAIFSKEKELEAKKAKLQRLQASSTATQGKQESSPPPARVSTAKIGERRAIYAELSAVLSQDAHVKSEYLKNYRRQLEAAYRPFFLRQNLSAEEQSRALDIMMQYRTNRTEIEANAFLNKMSIKDPSVLKSLDDLKETLDKSLAGALPEDTVKKLADYNARQNERTVVNQVVAALYDGPSPLSSQQAEQLQGALSQLYSPSATLKGQLSSADPDSYPLLAARASKFLDARQLDAVKAMLASQEAAAMLNKQQK